MSTYCCRCWRVVSDDQAVRDVHGFMCLACKRDVAERADRLTVRLLLRHGDDVADRLVARIARERGQEWLDRVRADVVSGTLAADADTER